MQIDILKKHISWYFNQSQSVLGCRSNWYVVLNSLGGSRTVSDNSDGIIVNLKGIRRHRLIHQALLALPPEQYRYIQALYDDEYKNKYPPTIRAVFEEKTGLALCMHDNLKDLNNLCSKSVHKSLNTMESVTLTQYHRNVNTTYEQTHEFLKFNEYIIKLQKSGGE